MIFSGKPEAIVTKLFESKTGHKSGADPGFPVGGGADPRGSANIRFCQNFRKLHEIKKILGRRGAGHEPSAPPQIRHCKIIIGIDLFFIAFK